MSKQSTYDIQQAAFAWLDGIEDAEGEVSEDISPTEYHSGRC